MTFVPTLSLVSRALSPVYADLIPSPKRACFNIADIIRSRGIDVRVVAETVARDKIGTDTRNIVEGGDDMVTHPVMLEDVQEAAQEERAAEGTYETLRSLGCRIIRVESAVTALTKRIAELERDNRRLRGTASVDGQRRVKRITHPAMPKDIPEPAQEGAVEVTYGTLGDFVQRFHDHREAIPVHRVHVIKGVQRVQGHRIVRVVSALTDLTKRVAELERDYKRLRGTASVESQKVGRLQRGMSHMQREMRQMKMPNTRSGASMTHEEVKELVAHRVVEEIEARKVARNHETLNENEDEQEGENGGNENEDEQEGENGGNENGGNRGNGNGENEGNKNEGNRGNENEGNGENGNHGMNYGGFMPMARECTFQDFLKCKTHTFSGSEGIV
nr:hypothetical protein [Tanacetum cinerariifolium]